MLSFLHTSDSHIQHFTKLLNEIDPTISAQHIVRADILSQIQMTGIVTEQIRNKLQQIVAEIATTSSHILCTCSTIGGLVEDFANDNLTILRVDRPMAEKAVALGEKIVVLATFEPTLEPTCELIRSVTPINKSIQLESVQCVGAWDYFLAGNISNYYQCIAESITKVQGDVIVLAQASMAGALDYQKYTDLPILSSPFLGVQAMVQAYQNRSC